MLPNDLILESMLKSPTKIMGSVSPKGPLELMNSMQAFAYSVLESSASRTSSSVSVLRVADK